MLMQRWTIIVLLVGGLTAQTLTAAAAGPPSPMVAVVPIQVQLRALGYAPGPIDGRGGRRTIGALRAYAKDRGIILNEATAGTVIARLRVEAYVMLLNGEATEESAAAASQGEPWGLDRW